MWQKKKKRFLNVYNDLYIFNNVYNIYNNVYNITTITTPKKNLFMYEYVRIA